MDERFEGEANRDDDLEKGNELVYVGAESLSGLAGAAVGLSFGPPGALVGAAAGPAATRVLRWAGREIRTRLLSSNEEVRIGGALAVAIRRIEERRADGQEPRRDGLFDPGSDPRGLLEGSLLAAARSYDEQKVPFIGAFYASFVFEEDTSAVTAHFLLHLLDGLTYRQLCALAYFSDPDTREERAELQAAAQEEGDMASPSLIAELGELANLGLIGFRQSDGQIANPLATIGGGQISATSLVNTALTALGETLVRMAELRRIAKDDRSAIPEALAGTIH